MSTQFFQIKEHVIPCQHIRHHPHGTSPDHPQETTLHLAIKQYTPLTALATPPPSNAITLLSAHALGFPKELYEPLFASLLRPPAPPIRSIWIADSAHEAASHALNEPHLGPDPSWFDHSRDLLLMVNHFRALMPRPLVGLAHSRGACELVNLSLMHPRLLSALVLVEPMIQAEAPPGPVNAAAWATGRRDLWDCREDAEREFRASKAFRKWDARVLDLYLRYGLRSVPTRLYPLGGGERQVPGEAVTLATTKHQEAWAFMRPNFEPIGDDARYERLLAPDVDLEREGRLLSVRAEAGITLRNLPFVRPSVFYVFGGKSPMSSARLQRQKLETTGTGVGGSGGVEAGKVESLVLPHVGHLAPFEDVEACGEAAAVWLGKWMEEWTREEEVLRGLESRTSEGGKGVRVSKEWKELMRKDPRTERPRIGKEKL